MTLAADEMLELWSAKKLEFLHEIRVCGVFRNHSVWVDILCWYIADNIGQLREPSQPGGPIYSYQGYSSIALLIHDRVWSVVWGAVNDNLIHYSTFMSSSPNICITRSLVSVYLSALVRLARCYWPAREVLEALWVLLSAWILGISLDDCWLCIIILSSEYSITVECLVLLALIKFFGQPSVLQ